MSAETWVNGVSVEATVAAATAYLNIVPNGTKAHRLITDLLMLLKIEQEWRKAYEERGDEIWDVLLNIRVLNNDPAVSEQVERIFQHGNIA